jgi:hypothetical protein
LNAGEEISETGKGEGAMPSPFFSGVKPREWHRGRDITVTATDEQHTHFVNREEHKMSGLAIEGQSKSTTMALMIQLIATSC